jgi:hypothetical protein
LGRQASERGLLEVQDALATKEAELRNVQAAYDSVSVRLEAAISDRNSYKSSVDELEHRLEEVHGELIASKSAKMQLQRLLDEFSARTDQSVHALETRSEDDLVAGVRAHVRRLSDALAESRLRIEAVELAASQIPISGIIEPVAADCISLQITVTPSPVSSSSDREATLESSLQLMQDDRALIMEQVTVAEQDVQRLLAENEALRDSGLMSSESHQSALQQSEADLLQGTRDLDSVHAELAEVEAEL